MPLHLKHYQQDCLDALAAYFTAVNSLKNIPAIPNPARAAFDNQIQDQTPRRLYHPVPQLEQTPYVCLRVPTGGGKTFLAANALKIAADKLFRQEFLLTLWLAPTNTIVDQTLKALRDRSHPYRQSIDQHFGGNVTVLSLEEAFYLQRSTLDNTATIIVSTFAGLNVEDTANRRVYDQNGALMPAFTGLSESQRRELLTSPSPGIAIPGSSPSQSDQQPADDYTPSLANLIRLHHPLIIMDEAHNARTPRAFNTLQRFRPLAILELTATPSTDKPPSNVLHHVSAAQLKADGMIKLPVKLRCRPQWKEAVQAALSEQKRLELLARENEIATGRYIRPIVLFQAQNEGAENITAEVLKQSLINDFNIPPQHAAIATGKTDELGKTDLFATDCPIRYIITVAKLREGWDCSFAYILCSVTNLSSHTAVEQILGRVLRQPYALPNAHADLNTAYAFATSQNFIAAADDLKDALVDSGFSQYEAAAGIEADPTGTLFDQSTTLLAPIIVPVSQAPNLAQVSPELAAKLHFDPANKTLAWNDPAPMSPVEKQTVALCFPAADDKQQVERIYRKSRNLDASPAALEIPISVPVLSVRDGNNYSLFEDQFDDADWKLSDCDPTLTPEHFSLSIAPDQTGIIDVTKEGKITTSFIEEAQEQLAIFQVGPQTITELTIFLSKNITAIELTHADKIDFLHKAIRRLMDGRGYSIASLCAQSYKLLDALTLRVNSLRLNSRNERFQKFLLPDCDTPVEVSPKIAFQFPFHIYPAHSYYDGPYKFHRHYYSNVGDLNSEEAHCAALIDNHPKVKYWVRNIERRPNDSFWLQTSTDKFYPDFVAILNDGRFLVLEYKGEDRATNEDSTEKQMLGKLWQDRSNGTCLFRFVTKATMQQSLNSI